MIKEAINRILALRDPEKIDVRGIEYVKAGYTKEQVVIPVSIRVNTLTAVKNYIESNFDGVNLKEIMVHVVDRHNVLISSNLKEVLKFREIYMNAVYQPLQYHRSFGQYYDMENFNIWMQTEFLESENRKALTRLTSSITDSQVSVANDDGVSQEVMAKTGVARLEAAAVPNPVILEHYCTFPEVAQPSRKFILRLKSGITDKRMPTAALFEADGGEWKNVAIKHISDWLKTNLPDGILIIA